MFIFCIQLKVLLKLASEIFAQSFLSNIEWFCSLIQTDNLWTCYILFVTYNLRQTWRRCKTWLLLDIVKLQRYILWVVSKLIIANIQARFNSLYIESHINSYCFSSLDFVTSTCSSWTWRSEICWTCVMGLKSITRYVG